MLSSSVSLGATLWLSFTSHLLPCAAMTGTGRPGHGLVGYGIPMFDPVCPYACRGILSASRLNCSMTMIMDGAPMVDTSTSCYATDTDFLASMAYCIKPRCTDLELWKIEDWWYHHIPGKQVNQPVPKWTYQETLYRVPTLPTTTIASGAPLNTTVLVSDKDYQSQAKSMVVFADVEINHSKYGLVLLISSVVIPVAASLVSRLSLPSQLISARYLAFLGSGITSPQRGGRCAKFLPNLTRGQAIFVFYLLTINIILCAVGYRLAEPSPWYPSRTRQVLTYVANRTGVLSFANVPVLMLYAGRNTVIHWLTNWTDGTFILLHSWVAVISAIQAILHSLIYLVIYVQKGTHDSESRLPYWYWGIIATLGFSILLPGSIELVRKKAYEVFLASHFAIALVSIVGCYLHIYYKFGHQWGYELWIYIAFAIWGFDRLLRLLRMARYGIRTASIKVIDDDYVRLDVEGVTGDGHAYLYFPTLTWRVWENHPFSVITTVASASPASSPDGSLKQLNTFDAEDDIAGKDVESRTTCVHLDQKGDSRTLGGSSAALTFFIRTRTGATSLLKQHQKLPVLVESDYHRSYTISPASSLICLAGGVGVTAVIPVLGTHLGPKKLYWSCRSRALVDAVEPLIAHIERDVLVGGRYDVQHVLERELAVGMGEVVVLVSGPRPMMDEVRAVVCRLAQTSPRSIRLLSESFDW